MIYITGKSHGCDRNPNGEPVAFCINLVLITKYSGLDQSFYLLQIT
ncbi:MULTISPECIES: hypothetical protein [Moorena]|nr:MULTISPECIES: hypothetical protein [Moorena]NEO25286.1 hypothetical protein [Moorena sp. SIO4A5]